MSNNDNQDNAAAAVAEVAAMTGVNMATSSSSSRRERDTTADEAVMGAAADGVGGFEILDETGERVKTRFQQFLME
jgi:hypothetical protein